MPSARVTTRGRITVPKEVREKLALRPGSAVEFYLGTSGQVLMRAKTLVKARSTARVRRKD